MNMITFLVILIVIAALWRLFKFSSRITDSDKVHDLSNQYGIDPIISDNQVVKKRLSIFGEYRNNLYKKEYLMTRNEAYFFRLLSNYLADKDYIICPKVRVEDIIGVKTNYGFRPWKVSGRLDRSHIDFLLIGKTDLKTKYAIEVDDSSHDSNIAKEKDEVKNEACEIAGIPLIRLRNAYTIKNDLANFGI